MRSITFNVHVAGIAKSAVDVMYKLIAYSEHTTHLPLNRLRHQEFLEIVRLAQETSWAEIVEVMAQCSKAVASKKEYDYVGTRRRMVGYGSWPVFRNVFVTAEEVIFEINPLMWEDRYGSGPK